MDSLLLIDDYLVRIAADGAWSLNCIEDTKYDAAYNYALAECSKIIIDFEEYLSPTEFQYQPGNVVEAYNPITNKKGTFTVAEQIVSIEFDVSLPVPVVTLEKKYASAEDDTLYDAWAVESEEFNEWPGFVISQFYPDAQRLRCIDTDMPILYLVQQNEPLFCIREDAKVPKGFREFIHTT